MEKELEKVREACREEVSGLVKQVNCNRVILAHMARVVRRYVTGV